MESTHPFHHNLKTGLKGLSPEQELWYEFHIECLMRKIFEVQTLPDDGSAPNEFLNNELDRIESIVYGGDNAGCDALQEEPAPKPQPKKEYLMSCRKSLQSLMEDVYDNIADKSTAAMFGSAITGWDIFYDSEENVAIRFEFAVLPLWFDAVSKQLPALDQSIQNVLNYRPELEVRCCSAA